MTYSSQFIHLQPEDPDPTGSAVKLHDGTISVGLQLGKQAFSIFPGTKDVDLLSALQGAAYELDKLIGGSRDS